jgi:hypothetical protein
LTIGFLSLATGGTVSGPITAQILNSANTFQIGGADVLKADSSDNTASGFTALKANKTGSRNTAHGSKSLSLNTTGNDNTAHGWDTLMNVTTANDNTAVGSAALSMNTTGNANTAHGKEALKSEISGNNNVAHGLQVLMNHQSGDDNTAIGTQAGMNLLTGTKNLLMGKLAGQNLASSESKNILINHDGVAGDNNTTRLGNDIEQKKAYIAGIYETDHSQNTNAKHVLIDTTTGQLGIDPNAAQTSVNSISASTGLVATGTAAAPTLAVDTTVIAQKTDVASAIVSAQATATSLASAAQTAAQNASLSLASGGTVAAPVTVQAAVEAQTLNSDNTFQIQKQDVLKADANLNTASGFNVLKSIKTGIQNTAHGEEALKSEISGNNNVAHGLQALMSHTSGDDNTAIGTQAGMNLQTGIKNLLFGKLAGQNLASSESKNILINNDGVAGESNATRIGNETEQKKAYIAGVFNKNVDDSNSETAVFIDKFGNLGTVQSSRRYKEDIHDMGEASDGLLRLRPVTFLYKKPNEDGSKPLQYGLIAEEVAKVYPDLVVRNKDGQIETVQYYKLDAMLLNEVQKLSRANTEDQAQIAVLRSQVAEQLKQGQEQLAAIKQLSSQVQTLRATVARGRSAKRHARVASTSAKKMPQATATHPLVASLSSETGRRCRCSRGTCSL